MSRSLPTVCNAMLATLFASCASPRDAVPDDRSAGSAAAPHEPATDPRRDAARALVRAAPADWEPAAERVLALGPSMAAVVVAAIRDEPASAGEQMAIATLGALGGPDAEAALLEWLDLPDARSAAEAALALGRRPPDDAARTTRVSALRRIVGSTTADPLVRTAAAASLLRLGDRATAVPFLHAVLIADAPDARATRDRLGLPNRPRWALERWIAIESIRDALGDDFGLDPDLAWPDLVDRASRFADAALTEDRR